MSYTLETSIRATAFTRGRAGNSIQYIIIHHWGDPAQNPQFDSIVSYFARGGNKTSAHYIVEAGRVAQMVSDSDTSYAAGNWVMNLKSINLECNPRASDEDKKTVCELIANLRAVHGNIPIIGHQDVVPTDCPGRYYPPNDTLAPWLGSSASTPAAPASNDLNALADAVLRGEYGNGDERKRRLGSNYAAVQAIVNQKLGAGSAPAPAPAAPAVDINALAEAVLRGEYGNGDDRRNRLGANYDAVQALVNRKLQGAPAPGPDLNALADAVIRGEYGNGDERKRRLGANYAAVQALVNRKLR